MQKYLTDRRDLQFTLSEFLEVDKMKKNMGSPIKGTLSREKNISVAMK